MAGHIVKHGNINVQKIVSTCRTKQYRLRGIYKRLKAESELEARSWGNFTGNVWAVLGFRGVYIGVRGRCVR